jgi:hypothetical protein
MRRETFWNWAACSTVLPDGRVLGLNLSCGVNETSFSENAAWLNNTRSSLPQVAFRYNRRDLREPWQISSQCGRVDLVFVPALTAHQENIHAGIVASNFRQIFGHYTGRIALPESNPVMLQDSPGLAERHFARW